MKLALSFLSTVVLVPFVEGGAEFRDCYPNNSNAIVMPYCWYKTGDSAACYESCSMEGYTVNGAPYDGTEPNHNCVTFWQGIYTNTNYDRCAEVCGIDQPTDYTSVTYQPHSWTTNPTCTDLNSCDCTPDPRVPIIEASSEDSSEASVALKDRWTIGTVDATDPGNFEYHGMSKTWLDDIDTDPNGVVRVTLYNGDCKKDGSGPGLGVDTPYYGTVGFIPPEASAAAPVMTVLNGDSAFAEFDTTSLSWGVEGPICMDLEKCEAIATTQGKPFIHEGSCYEAGCVLYTPDDTIKYCNTRWGAGSPWPSDFIEQTCDVDTTENILLLTFASNPRVMTAMGDFSYYTDDDGDRVDLADGELKYCVRLGLYDGVHNDEINFYESVVTLTITMDGTFTITDIGVEPKAQGQSDAAQSYSVVASLCTAQEGTKFNQGAAIKVCIALDTNAVNDQVQLQQVDYFTWTRSNTGDQEAIVAGQEASNGLTLMETIGTTNVEITSVLFAKFYESEGTVTANGSVTMAFGAGAGDGSDSDSDGDTGADVVPYSSGPECTALCSQAGNRGPEALDPLIATPGPNNGLWHIVQSYINEELGGYDARAKYGNLINCWDISQLTSLDRAFYTFNDFNEDLDCWDTSGVTSMVRVFYNARAFNKDITMWDTSNVVTMFALFIGAASFNQDIEKWNVDNVENFVEMFYAASSFNQNLCSWMPIVRLNDNDQDMFSVSGCENKDRKPTETGRMCSPEVCPTRRLGSSSSSSSSSSNNKMNRRNKRTLQEGGTGGGTTESAFEVSAELNKADDGPVALQQTAGGTGTSITVVATTIVGLVSTILLA